MPGLVLLGLLSSNLYSGCFWIFPHTSSYFTILQQSGLRSFQPSLALVPRSDVRDIRQPPASPAAREPTPHWHLWVLLVHPTKSFLTMDWVTGWVWWENLRLKHVETMVLYMVLCCFFQRIRRLQPSSTVNCPDSEVTPSPMCDTPHPSIKNESTKFH